MAVRVQQGANGAGARAKAWHTSWTTRPPAMQVCSLHVVQVMLVCARSAVCLHLFSLLPQALAHAAVAEQVPAAGRRHRPLRPAAAQQGGHGLQRAGGLELPAVLGSGSSRGTHPSMHPERGSGLAPPSRGTRPVQASRSSAPTPIKVGSFAQNCQLHRLWIEACRMRAGRSRRGQGMPPGWPGPVRFHLWAGRLHSVRRRLRVAGVWKGTA